MAKEKNKEPEYIGGGLNVTLTKDWEEYGVKRPAGTLLVVSRDGYKMLKEGGFLDPVSTPPDGTSHPDPSADGEGFQKQKTNPLKSK